MSAENVDATRAETPRINPIHYVWIGLPLILLFLGGAIGGAIGGGAVSINYQIFKNKAPMHIKYLITGAMTIVSVVLWLVIASAIKKMLGW